VIDVVGQGWVFGAQCFLRRWLWKRLFYFEFDLWTLYPKSYRGEAVQGHRRDALATEEESVCASKIADSPVPVLKDNFRMGPADERIIDEKIALFQTAYLEPFVESKVTPCTGAHLCGDLYGWDRALVWSGHGCQLGYYTAGHQRVCENSVLQGHGFSRVPMSLRLTKGDENQGQIEWQANISCPATKDRVPHPSRFWRRVG